MAKMTPEREAAYALDWDLPRADLSEAVQLAYDRLRQQRQAAATAAASSREAGAVSPSGMQNGEHVYRNTFVQSITGAGIALFLGIGVAIALDPKGPPYLGGIVGTVGAYLAWMVGWQSSVRLRSDGVEVNNLLVTCFVPWEIFREFRIANGLKVVMTDGRSIGSFAFGGSLAGQLTGYRRMRWLVESLEGGRQALTAERHQPGPPRRTIPSSETRKAYLLRVRVAIWPLLAFIVPLEVLGLLTSTLR
jgi:hypothetical protein